MRKKKTNSIMFLSNHNNNKVRSGKFDMMKILTQPSVNDKSILIIFYSYCITIYFRYR